MGSQDGELAPCLPQSLPHTHPVLSGRRPSSCLLLLRWHHWMREAGKAASRPASTWAPWLHPSLRRPPRVVPKVSARPHPAGNGAQISVKAPGHLGGFSLGLPWRARAAARTKAQRRKARVGTARTRGSRPPRGSARAEPHAPLRKRRPFLPSDTRLPPPPGQAAITREDGGGRAN